MTKEQYQQIMQSLDKAKKCFDNAIAMMEYNKLFIVCPN